MSILDRLFGVKPAPIREVDDLEPIRRSAVASLDALKEKLSQDPCAADPTRQGCRRRDDPALALLHARRWREEREHA